MGTIAPHVNNEVRLVLSGAKPLATIEKVKDPYGYALAISMAGTGALTTYVRPSGDSMIGEVVLTLPSKKHLIEEYVTLLLWGVKRYGIKNYHRKMGKLFGYSEDDIEAFINSSIDCSCSKCNGM